MKTMEVKYKYGDLVYHKHEPYYILGPTSLFRAARELAREHDSEDECYLDEEAESFFDQVIGTGDDFCYHCIRCNDSQVVTIHERGITPASVYVPIPLGNEHPVFEQAIRDIDVVFRASSNLNTLDSALAQGGLFKLIPTSAKIYELRTDISNAKDTQLSKLRSILMSLIEATTQVTAPPIPSIKNCVDQVHLDDEYILTSPACRWCARKMEQYGICCWTYNTDTGEWKHTA